MTNQNTLLALGVSLNEQGITSEDVIARFLTVIDAPEASDQLVASFYADFVESVGTSLRRKLMSGTAG